MTTSKVTTERLQKISSWREKHGDDANVIIPALEAKQIVDELLVAREAQSKPVGFFTEVSGKKGVIWHNGAPPDDTAVYTAPPSVPDGMAVVPRKLTAENGAKSALIGEFTEIAYIHCTECFGDDDCGTCDGSGRIAVHVPVSWTTIKAIWSKAIEHFDTEPKP